MLIRSRRRLWGLGRAAAIEYPGIWGGLIDLQFDGDRTSDIDLLAAELLHPNGETQIAISAAGQRNVPRFVRQSLAELPAQLPGVRAGRQLSCHRRVGDVGARCVQMATSVRARNTSS